MIGTEFSLKMLNEAIDLSLDNTAGLIMSRRSIMDLLTSLWTSRQYIDYIDIDKYMADYENDCGYLMKASDFKCVIKSNNKNNTK